MNEENLLESLENFHEFMERIGFKVSKDDGKWLSKFGIMYENPELAEHIEIIVVPSLYTVKGYRIADDGMMLGGMESTVMGSENEAEWQAEFLWTVMTTVAQLASMSSRNPISIKRGSIGDLKLLQIKCNGILFTSINNPEEGNK